MYFPGDPLFALDPIYQSITDPGARDRAGRHVRPRPDHARSGAPATAGTSCSPAATAPRSSRGRGSEHDATPGPDRRPVLRLPCRTPAARAGAAGHPGAIRLHGTCSTATASRCPDALLEIWQADAGRPGRRGPRGSLRRDGWTFTGWGRAATDARALLVHHARARRRRATGGRRSSRVTVFARGLLDRLFTRAYLPGTPTTVAADPLLAALRPAARDRWSPRRDEHGLVFDIHLQGERRDGVPDLPRPRPVA